MWKTREESMKAMNANLKNEADVIYEGFALIDKMIDQINGLNNPDPFSRVSSLILTKGRNLCHGILCLEMEGLGQEAGALLRPTIESIELLCYLEKKPERVELILSDKKQSAGEIAKEIEGSFKDLRNHLNLYASHLSVSYEAMNHLIDFKSEVFLIKKKQGYSEKVLRQNLMTLFSFLFFLSYEGAMCLNECNSLSEEVALQFDNWKQRGCEYFECQKKE